MERTIWVSSSDTSPFPRFGLRDVQRPFLLLNYVTTETCQDKNFPKTKRTVE